MDSKRSGPQAPRLAQIRSRWLDAVIAALQDDQPVVGAALVGSLGGDRADAWRAWGSHPDAWFCVLHGEVLCRP